MVSDGDEYCQREPLKEFEIIQEHVKQSIAVYIKVINPSDLITKESFQNIVEFRYTVQALEDHG